MPTYLHVAWCNLLHNRRHTLTATGGIGFAVLLVFIQLGFLDAARRGSTLVYADLAFDVALVSDRYQSVAAPGKLDPIRLAQARSVAGVADTSAFYLVNAAWRNTATDRTFPIMLLGVPGEPHWFTNPGLRAGATALRGGEAVLMDAFSIADFGDLSTGAPAEINGKRLVVAGQFTQGMSMFSEGAAALSRNALDRVARGVTANPSLGLIQVTPGTDPRRVVAALRAILPADTRALTREELIRGDQDYFVAVKPVGIVFKLGVFVALAAGSVILFQVLSTEITTRLPEYATMKAMGLANGFIHRIGIAQALLYGDFGYAAALLIAAFVFHLVFALSRLPTRVTPSLALDVAGLLLGVCIGSCLLALRRVRRADPAELF